MLEGRRSVVSASIGLASSTHTRPLFGEALLREADAAMYQAKRSGKNSCVVFEPDMHAAAFARLELQADLALAAEHEEFHLNFQPYFDLVDRRLTGFEALIRWTHPIRGVVSPVDFIPLAESTGLIHSIGDWVLREACREAATWQAAKAGDPAPTVNVNISALQIQEPGLVEGVLAALELGGLEANRLVLEITEGVVVRRSDDIVATLQRLRQLGVRVAIDDFGTGYSSLSYLQNLPVDILKIDKSFVDHLATDGDDSSVAKLIVQIGRTLHLHVVAEGVELAEQVDSLLSLGCDSAQGFYLGRPLSADAARALCDFADPLAVPLPHLPTTAA
jgi:EAL domain-containing protein (putative c-di-GMP-specific phosphodiesterase class I)